MANLDRIAQDWRYFWCRCLIATTTLVGGLALLWFIWVEGGVLLLLFAAFLVAVVLDALGGLIARVSGLTRHLSVIVALLVIAATMSAAVTLGAMNITAQMPRLQTQINQSVNRIDTRLQQHPLTEHFFHSSRHGTTRARSSVAPVQRLTRNLSSAVSLTLASLSEMVVVLIIGIYLALRPRLYHDGLLRLFPPSKQARVAMIANEAADAVRRWLAGRAISMGVVAIGTTTGLWGIGIHFPFLLGFIAGLLTFIPYLGALVSAIPALLVASLHGLWPMFYVALLYVGLHVLEGYLIDPLVQRRTASIAPAFLLSVQMLGGAVAGVLGVALATPIALVITVVIQFSYVEGIIGETPHLPNHATHDG